MVSPGLSKNFIYRGVIGGLGGKPPQLDRLYVYVYLCPCVCVCVCVFVYLCLCLCLYKQKFLLRETLLYHMLLLLWFYECMNIITSIYLFTYSFIYFIYNYIIVV